jgi:hypothetical protein
MKEEEEEAAAAAVDTVPAATAREEQVQLLSLERQLTFRRVSPRLAARWRAIQVEERVQHPDDLEAVDGEEQEHQQPDPPPPPPQEPQGRTARLFAAFNRILAMKKNCLIMYISVLTLIITLLGYLAPLAKYFKLHFSKTFVDNMKTLFGAHLNDTVDFYAFVNSSVLEEE